MFSSVDLPLPEAPSRHDEFARVKIEVDAVQRDDVDLAGVIDLANAAGFENDAGGFRRRRGNCGIHRVAGR